MFQFQNSYVPMSIVEDRRREAAERRLARQFRKSGRRHPRVDPMLGSARLRRTLTAANRRSRRS